MLMAKNAVENKSWLQSWLHFTNINQKTLILSHLLTTDIY